MKLDELARHAARTTRTAARSMPVVPLERARTRRNLLVAVPAFAAAAVLVGALAVLATRAPEASPVISSPTPPTTLPVEADAPRVLPDLVAPDQTLQVKLLDLEDIPLYGLDLTGTAPWIPAEPTGSGTVEASMGVSPSGALFVVERTSRQLQRLDGAQPAILATWDDLVPVAVAATDDLIFVDGITDRPGGPRDLVVLGPSGVEVARFEISAEASPLAGVELWVDGSHIYEVTWMAEGVLQMWKPVATVAGEPTDYTGPVSLGRPEADGGYSWLGGNTVVRRYPDGRTVAWTNPEGYLVSSYHAYEDGMLVVYLPATAQAVATPVVATLHPDGTTRLLAYDTSREAGPPATTTQAVAGDVLFDLAVDGVSIGRLPLAELQIPAALGPVDVSGETAIGLSAYGELRSFDGASLLPSDNSQRVHFSQKPMAWDGDRGIVYLDAAVALHHVTPEGDRLVTGTLGQQYLVDILDVSDGLVAISTDPLTAIWIDLATGDQVAGPDEGARFRWSAVDYDGFALIAQGRKAYIDWPSWIDVPRGEGGEMLGDFELPELVIEDAATGEELGRYAVATRDNPYLTLHDFDGRRIIISHAPFEPADPPTGVFLIDLECADCTQVQDAIGSTTWSLVGVTPTEGPVGPVDLPEN